MALYIRVSILLFYVFELLGLTYLLNDPIWLSRSSNKMPADVKTAVRAAAEVYGKLSEDEAKQFIGKMEREGRLIEECWS